MQLSYQWLRSWVDLDASVTLEDLVQRLNMAGIEVESYRPVSVPLPKVVVGHVRAVVPHPNADRLRLCKVSTALDSDLTWDVVCGANNVRTGMKVAFAQVGAVLPNGQKIKQAKIRGQLSQGMLCSASELGFSEEFSAGILDLADDAPVNQAIYDYFQLEDVILHFKITPNRGDCFSVLGIAREISAIYQCPLTAVAIEETLPTAMTRVPVRIETKAACPLYLGRVVSDINVQATTPLWISERLRRSGIRSVSIVVDILHYVMLELGQPLHAFDRSKLCDGIVVRYAKLGESLPLLNGDVCLLTDDDLVIADEKNTLHALAGVMGGIDSKVVPSSREIFIESAHFSPRIIAKQSKKHGLTTEAAHRFERGVDPELVALAMQRVSQLFSEICHARVTAITNCVAVPMPCKEPIVLRYARIKRVLGVEIPTVEVKQILMHLGMRPQENENGLRLHIPSYRFDLVDETDCIEELIRVWGYDKIPTTQPQAAVCVLTHHPQARAEYSARNILLSRGYRASITYSFVAAQLQNQCNRLKKSMLKLKNPLQDTLSVMRTNLWPGLLQAAHYNHCRQQQNIRLFEIGQCFFGTQRHHRRSRVKH